MKRRLPRDGLTLLEVMMALAILAGAMAVIGELVRGGMRASQQARDLTQAQLICESVVSQVVAGAIPATAASNVPFEDDPQWVYSITTETGAQTGLFILQVTVGLASPSKQRPVQFTIDRWMIDPTLEGTVATDSQSASQTGSGSQTGTGSQPSGGTQSGGSR